MNSARPYFLMTFLQANATIAWGTVETLDIFVDVFLDYVKFELVSHKEASLARFCTQFALGISKT